MSAPPGPLSLVARGVVAAGALGVGALAYAGLYEVDAYRLRRVRLPVLPEGAAPIRVLHISDLHLTPWTRARQTWVSRLAALEPDLVVNTGDNLAHVDAVPFVLRSLGRLLDVPGVFVWGSNDYFAPTFKNPAPLSHCEGPDRSAQAAQAALGGSGRGFHRARLGGPDPRARACSMCAASASGSAAPTTPTSGTTTTPRWPDRSTGTMIDVALGVTHAPYRRVLDAMTYDGHDLILAGHTHGGQVCVPGLGALVTNCDLDPARAKGLSSHSRPGRPPGCTYPPAWAPPPMRRSASPARRRRPS